MGTFTYRSRVVEIEAFQYIVGTEEDQQTLAYPAWLLRALGDGTLVVMDDNSLKVTTLEGDVRIRDTDWICKGTEDELYPCKDSIFRNKYDKV